MNKERLKEIKDSVNFQREILKAHNMETLCIDEEQELIEEIERLNKERNKTYENGLNYFLKLQEKKDEIERLNNIIKNIKGQLNYLETYSSKEDVFEDMKRRLDRIESIVNRK